MNKRKTSAAKAKAETLIIGRRKVRQTGRRNKKTRMALTCEQVM